MGDIIFCVLFVIIIWIILGIVMGMILVCNVKVMVVEFILKVKVLSIFVVGVWELVSMIMLFGDV